MFTLFNLFLNWRIIALQNFVVFCQTSTWISHKFPGYEQVCQLEWFQLQSLWKWCAWLHILICSFILSANIYWIVSVLEAWDKSVNMTDRTRITLKQTISILVEKCLKFWFNGDPCSMICGCREAGHLDELVSFLNWLNSCCCC